MRITVAKTAGFCFGVDRAVKMADDLLAAGRKVATLGELIHNPVVTGSLAARGARVIERPEEAEPDEVVVIRSHGVGPEVYRVLEARGIQIADATCPKVRKVHRIVGEAAGKGHLILIAGDPEHPEVLGTLGYAGEKAFVIPDSKAMQDLSISDKCPKNLWVTMVSQTTFSVAKWLNCVSEAKKLYTKIEIFDTICTTTWNRQREAESLAAESDVMFVIGGRKSSNTRKLYEVCAPVCRTYLIERAGELCADWFKGAVRVGISAGASTPASTIKEVQETMTDLVKNNGDENEEFNFEEALEQSLKSVHTGEKVTAVVTGFTPNEVVVDISGIKHASYIPMSELTEESVDRPEDVVSIGDTLDLIVVRVNDVEGTMVLSKKRFDAMAGLEKVYEAADTGEILEGNVVDIVKGGVIAITNGVRVFIPASHATMSRNEPIENLRGKHVRFKILEVNRQRKRAVGSIRQVLKEERKAKEEAFWQTAEVGQHFTGEVKSLTSYGAFVDLGGVDGMVHISELSWNRIKHPSEVVKVGQQIEVYIRDLDVENHKISLGYKKDEDNPWFILQRDYKVGDVVKVKIVSMTTFGAFAEIIPGIDGLIHISQIALERVAKPQDVLTVGEEVEAKITEMDFDKKRISLSIRALREERQQEPDAEAVSEAE